MRFGTLVFSFWSEVNELKVGKNITIAFSGGPEGGKGGANAHVLACHLPSPCCPTPYPTTEHEAVLEVAVHGQS